MSKQLRNMIIAIVVLAASGGAYFALSQKGSEKQQAEATAQNVYNDGDAKIVKIDISTPTETGSLIKDGTNWVVEGKENIELSQINIDQAAAYAKTFSYEREINEGSPSDYGLTTGTIFTAVSDGGKEYKIIVGDAIMGDGGYYAMAEDKIYVIDNEMGKSLKKSISDYRDRNPEFVDYTQLLEFKVARKDKENIAVTPNPDGAIEEGVGEYLLTEGFACTMPVLTEAFADNIGGPVYEITAAEFIDEPESDEVYGFDDPYMTIDISDTLGYSCGIVVGDEAGDGLRYAKFSGKDYVCKVRTAKTDKIYNANIFDIIAKYYVNVHFAKASSVEFYGDGINDVFTIDAQNGKIFRNNVEASAENFSQLYTDLASVTIDGKAEKEFGNSVFAFNLKLTDGSETKVEFFEYDNNFYGAEINGVKAAVSGRKMVDEFINELKNY